jgi:hypothetical protein
MGAMNNKYEIIVRLDYASKPLAEAIFAFGEGWPLFRDYGMRLIDSNECQAMQANERLPMSNWNTIKQGYALIAKEGVRKYTTTFDKLTQGLCDFREGWHAAEKFMQPKVELGRLDRPWCSDMNTGYRPKRRVPTRRTR